jgi:hypothetical protein
MAVVFTMGRQCSALEEWSVDGAEKGAKASV